MACSHTQHCELFAQFALNPALQVWQSHYCEADHSRCARYQLSLKGQAVPLNLLPNGKRIEAPRSSSAYGAAALFNAILKERVHMVDSLLRTGVDINVRGSEGMTPLMAAATVGNTDILALLLDHGADPSMQSAQGETAMDIAQRYGHQGFAERLSMVIAASPRRDEGLDSTAAGLASAEVIPLAAKPLRPFYLQAHTKQPAELAHHIKQICQEAQLGIDCIVQKGASKGSGATVMVLTAPSTLSTLVKVVRRIERHPTLVGRVECMRMERVSELDDTRAAS